MAYLIILRLALINESKRRQRIKFKEERDALSYRNIGDRSKNDNKKYHEIL